MDQIPLLSTTPLEKYYLGNPGFVASYLPNTLKRMILSVRDNMNILCFMAHQYISETCI